MGKKGKVGKQRKDTYYKLAKQKGFRSRAAFKLIQLNRKFQFLENSRVCVDLCAAPGGWLQVASEYMPVSSVIVGVDLVPITPIRNVITLQSDITTKQCFDSIESNLAGWKVDIVLHDGAPNVGKNWLHDAYSQNCLVLSALKIACNLLNKGGWFITKVFRSSDYNSLLWVFNKLFGKIHATKPQASRQESAEIFVVCQNFRKPAQIDPKFFDPSALFADISDFDDQLKKQKADLLKPVSKIKKTKAHGYEEGDILKTTTDVLFVTSNKHMDFLAQCHEIKFTNDDIIKHEATTEEIRECCKDLKILGRKDLLRLLKWRRTLRQDLTAKLLKAIKEGTYTNTIDEDGEGEEDNLDQLTIKSDEEDIESVPDLQLDDIEQQQNDERRKEQRRLRKKEEKRQKDYQQRVNYGMINHGDVLIEEENDLFNLKAFTGKKELEQIDDAQPDELVEEIPDPDDILKEKSQAKRNVVFSRVADVRYFELDEDYDEEEDVHASDDIVPEKPEEEKIAAPKTILKGKSAKAELGRLNTASNIGGGLLTDLMDVNQAKIAAASRFFERGDFNLDLENDLDTDLVDRLARSKRGPMDDEEVGLTRRKLTDDELSKFEDGLSSDEDKMDLDPEDETEKASDQGQAKKPIKLDPEGLAIASMMVSSEKFRADIEDEGWNRYVNDDSYLAPKWFREDEEKHHRRNIPVSQELVKEYKERLREVDAKPIKKVMEAKARQKRRAMKKMARVKKKVEAIVSNEDITEKERVDQIKKVYKGATKKKKKEVQLVRGRKGLPPKKPGKGKYKMVDSRLKKDLRAKERRDGKGKKGKKGKGRPKGGGAGKMKRKRNANNSMAPSKTRSKKSRR